MTRMDILGPDFYGGYTDRLGCPDASGEMSATRTRRWITFGTVLALCAVTVRLVVLHRGEDRERIEPSGPSWRGAPAVSKEPAKAAYAPDTPRSMRNPLSAPRPLVVVLQPDGEPLGGATVFLEGTAGTVSELGRTDEAGRFEIGKGVAHVEGEARVFAGAEGFLPSEERPLPPEGELVLRLGKGRVLQGRVVRLDGSLPSAPVRVLAAPTDRGGPDMNLLQAALLGDPRVLITETDRDGRFRFSAVDPDHRYNLTCGGSGLVARERAAGVQPGDAEVELQLVRGFAVRLQELDPEGAPLRFPSTAQGPFPGGWILEADDPTSQPFADRVAAVLAGLPIEFADPPPAIKLLLATCDTDARTLGPIRFEAAYVGYAPVDVRLYARSVDGPVPVETIRFTPTTGGFGSIVLRVASPAQGLEEAWSGCRGTLTLRRAGEAPLRVCVPELAARETRIDGVPHGRYRARFRSNAGPLTLPSPSEEPWSFEVGVTPVVLELQLADVGAVELSFRFRDGRVYAGPASCILDPASVMREAPASPILTYGGQAVVRWSGPPYRIPALPPHTYRIAVMEPETSHPSEDPFVPVEVRAGTRTPLEFELAR